MAAALAFGASSALAAPNEVAYVCEFDICLLDPDNPAAVTNLTDNGSVSFDERPAWSPDGKKLAFVSNFSDNTHNVFVMEPDAAGEGINLAVQVTHYTDGGYLNGPVWSPDGSRIAFVRGTAEGNRSVLVAASDGTTGPPVTIAAHGQHPSWAPDGGKIVYSEGQQVYLKNADGSGSATMLENGAGREPAWSPDGTRIAFDFIAHPAEFVDLHIVSSNGGGTPVIVPVNTQWTFSSWSPTGAQIAYQATSENDGYFRVVNADGSGDHGLPHITHVNANGPAPSWSPDSSRLVYQGFDYGNPADVSDDTTKVFIANTNGSGPATPLTGGDSHEPAWRPNPVIAPPPVVPMALPPLPGPTIEPKIVWITKRIHWTQGPIFVLSVACGGISCGAGAQGRSKSVAPPSGLSAATTSAKPKKEPKTVLVGSGKVSVPAGQTRPLKMRLNGKGISLLKQSGHLDISVTVTITPAVGQTTTAKKTIHVVFDKPKKKQKHG
jgi:TolB protein